MPWAGTKVWPFTKDGILANTPNSSGVYALWAGETLVYIGESNDMLRQLLELFGTPKPCIAKYVWLVFGYELVPTETQRVARHNGLIRELVPACNQAPGWTCLNSGRRGCTAQKGSRWQMAFLKKNPAQLQTQENDMHKALKAWYLTPGIQHDLRHKENEAVQTVLEVLERRRAAARKTPPDQLAAPKKPR